jgi:LCP family protein required for cell wall assembly
VSLGDDPTDSDPRGPAGGTGEGGEPEAPGGARAPESPAAGGVPESPAAGGVPESPAAGGVPESPAAGEVPESPAAGGVPESPAAGEVPESPAAGEVPESLGAGSAPGSEPWPEGLPPAGGSAVLGGAEAGALAAGVASPPARGLKLHRAQRKARLARRSRFRKWATRSGIAIVLIVVALVAAEAGYTGYRLNQIKRFTSPHVVAQKGPTENILLIGSTSRCAASKIAQFEYQCVDLQVNGVNSDVVLIMHLNGKDDKVSVLSIPRDTFVPGARSGSALCGTTWSYTPGTCSNKIDAALVEGPDQLTAAIEQDFGIQINHIVDLNFATFEDVVNALGGLWMYFPDRLVDDSSGLDIHHTGCIHLNGSEALELVRARHVYYFAKGQTPNIAAIVAANNSGVYYTSDSGGQYDGSGDLGRILRVHEFLKALASQVAARGLGNLITDNALIAAVAPNLTVDSSFSNSDMIHLVLDFHHVDLGTTPELTMPTINDAATYYYYGANYGDVIFPSEPQDQQAIDQFLSTTAPGSSLAPSGISVSVIDGTDSASATAAVASQLAGIGYRVVPTTVSNYVGPVSETTVLYDGPSHLVQAEKVMSSLSGAVVLGVGKTAAGADVSVVTGSIVSVVKPAAPPAAKAAHGASKKKASAHPATHSSTSSPSTGVSSTSSTSSSTTSTTTPSTPTTTNPNIGAPTLANPAIPSYDPQSCPRIPS